MGKAVKLKASTVPVTVATVAAASSEKCPRVWEKARRDRLKVLFDELSRLLPKYDPAEPPSRPNILQKAIEHIRDLQAQNEDLLKGGFDQVYKSKLDTWKKRVKNLVNRVEQLSDVLRTANIHLPPLALEPIPGWARTRPKHWSNKINLPEEQLQQVISNLTKKRSTTNRKRKISKENHPDKSPRLAKKAKKLKAKSPIVETTKVETILPSQSTAQSSSQNIASFIQTNPQPNTFILTEQGNLVPVLAPSVLTPVIINRPPVLLMQTPLPPQPVPVAAKPPPNKKRIDRESTVMTFANKKPISALSRQSHTRRGGKCVAHKTPKSSSDNLMPVVCSNVPAVSPTATFLSSFPVVSTPKIAEVEPPQSTESPTKEETQKTDVSEPPNETNSPSISKIPDSTETASHDNETTSGVTSETEVLYTLNISGDQEKALSKDTTPMSNIVENIPLVECTDRSGVVVTRSEVVAVPQAVIETSQTNVSTSLTQLDAPSVPTEQDAKTEEGKSEANACVKSLPVPQSMPSEISADLKTVSPTVSSIVSISSSSNVVPVPVTTSASNQIIPSSQINAPRPEIKEIISDTKVCDTTVSKTFETKTVLTDTVGTSAVSSETVNTSPNSLTSSLAIMSTSSTSANKSHWLPLPGLYSSPSTSSWRSDGSWNPPATHPEPWTIPHHTPYTQSTTTVQFSNASTFVNSTFQTFNDPWSSSQNCTYLGDTYTPSKTESYVSIPSFAVTANSSVPTRVSKATYTTLNTVKRNESFYVPPLSETWCVPTSANNALYKDSAYLSSKAPLPSTIKIDEPWKTPTFVQTTQDDSWRLSSASSANFYTSSKAVVSTDPQSHQKAFAESYSPNISTSAPSSTALVNSSARNSVLVNSEPEPWRITSSSVPFYSTPKTTLSNNLPTSHQKVFEDLYNQSILTSASSSTSMSNSSIRNSSSEHEPWRTTSSTTPYYTSSRTTVSTIPPTSQQKSFEDSYNIKTSASASSTTSQANSSVRNSSEHEPWRVTSSSASCYTSSKAAVTNQQRPFEESYNMKTPSTTSLANPSIRNATSEHEPWRIASSASSSSANCYASKSAVRNLPIPQQKPFEDTYNLKNSTTSSTLTNASTRNPSSEPEAWKIASAAPFYTSSKTTVNPPASQQKLFEEAYNPKMTASTALANSSIRNPSSEAEPWRTSYIQSSIPAPITSQAPIISTPWKDSQLSVKTDSTMVAPFVSSTILPKHSNPTEISSHPKPKPTPYVADAWGNRHPDPFSVLPQYSQQDTRVNVAKQTSYQYENFAEPYLPTFGPSHPTTKQQYSTSQTMTRQKPKNSSANPNSIHSLLNVSSSPQSKAPHTKDSFTPGTSESQKVIPAEMYIVPPSQESFIPSNFQFVPSTIPSFTPSLPQDVVSSNNAPQDTKGIKKDKKEVHSKQKSEKPRIESSKNSEKIIDTSALWSNQYFTQMTEPQWVDFTAEPKGPKPPVNWMTETDQRSEVFPSDDPFQTSYVFDRKGHNLLDFLNNPLESDAGKSRKKEDLMSQDYFGWMSMKVDGLVPSTLPTLVGDLALGNEPTPSKRKQDYQPSKNKTDYQPVPTEKTKIGQEYQAMPDEKLKNQNFQITDKHKTSPEYTAGKTAPEPFANLSKNIFEISESKEETIVLKNIFELPTAQPSKQRSNIGQNSFLSVSQLVEPNTGQQEVGQKNYYYPAEKVQHVDWKCGEKKCNKSRSNYSAEALLRPETVEAPVTPYQDYSKANTSRQRKQDYYRGQELKATAKTRAVKKQEFPTRFSNTYCATSIPAILPSTTFTYTEPILATNTYGTLPTRHPEVYPKPSETVYYPPIQPASCPNRQPKTTESFSQNLYSRPSTGVPRQKPFVPPVGPSNYPLPLGCANNSRPQQNLLAGPMPWNPLGSQPAGSSGSSLANFNLTTIFPEMNKKGYQYT